jgi:hypothetical protein
MPRKCPHLDAQYLPSRVGSSTESGSSLYLRDPDGARLELLAEPLGEMYGETVN